MTVKKYLPKIILIVVFFFVGYFYLEYHDRKVEKDRSSLQQEYTELTTVDSVAGRIRNVYHGNLSLYRNYPYQIYITFSDGTKWNITADIAGPGHSPTVDDVIQEGDSLLKLPYRSSFVIIKSGNQIDTSRYNFELR